MGSVKVGISGGGLVGCGGNQGLFCSCSSVFQSDDEYEVLCWLVELPEFSAVEYHPVFLVL